MDEFKREHSFGKLFLKRNYYFLHRSYLQLKKAHPVTILFYPQLPGWKTTVHQMLMNLGIGITNKLSDSFARAIFWEDRTFRQGRAALEEVCAREKIINYHCTNISKERVEEVFEQVFGYSLRANTATAGPMLRKSNYNGAHDGKVIQGPVTEIEEGVVYEKLLNNQLSENLFQDMRVTYLKGMIPLISLRFHDRECRFGKVRRATVEKVEDHLSSREIEQIRHFCRQLGFEYGDLDLIRNRDDQRLYIVDANPTPSVPSSSVMDPPLRTFMIQELSAAFKKAFLDQK